MSQEWRTVRRFVWYPAWIRIGCEEPAKFRWFCLQWITVRQFFGIQYWHDCHIVAKVREEKR